MYWDLVGHWPNMGHHIDNLYPELLEVANAADQMGVDGFTFAEHHFNDLYVTPAPLVLAGHLGALYPQRRLIVAVIVLTLHDVRRVAGEINMTDQLTNGRLEVGFGRGGAQFELDCFGVDFSKAREIFDDRFKALQNLYSGKDVSYEGPYTSYPKLTIMPPPRQRPHPLFWFSCMRPEAAYHCGRNGHNVLSGVGRRDPQQIKEMIDAFRRGQKEAAPTDEPQRISVHQTIYVTNDKADIEEKKRINHYNYRLWSNHFFTPGTVIKGITVPIEVKETVDDVGKGVIIGEPEYCIERILELKEFGFDQINFRTDFGLNHSDTMASMDRFANDVLPHLNLKSDSPEIGSQKVAAVA